MARHRKLRSQERLEAHVDDHLQHHDGLRLPLQPLLAMTMCQNPEPVPQYHERVFSAKKIRLPPLELAALQSVIATLNHLVLPEPRMKKAAPGTGRWIFEEPQYRDCFELRSSTKMIVYGPAGYGKSTLAGLIRHDLSRVAGQCVLHHFFSSSSAGLWEVLVSFVSSLLRQLWMTTASSVARTHDPRALGRVQAALQVRHDPESLFKSLWVVLCENLAVLKSFVLLVDGLDECQREGAPGIEYLAGLLDELSRTRAGILVIFSRQTPTLVKLWPAENAIVMDSSQTQGDIDILIEAAFESSSDASLTSSKLPRRILSDVRRIVYEKAQGSLLWLGMYLNHLQGALTNNDLDQRLVAFPSNLADAYHKLDGDGRRGLEDDNLKYRHELLHTVLSSSRFLTPDEMASLHQFRAKQHDTLINQITHLTKPFLVLSDGYIKFTHSSVREFLQSPDPRHGRSGSPSCLAETRSTLAEQTVAVLSKSEFSELGKIKNLVLQNIEELDSSAAASGTAQALTEPAYEYAANNWYKHVAEVAAPPKQLVRTVGNFLQSSQFVHWAEYVTNADREGTRLSRSREILRDWARRQRLELGNYCIQPYWATSSRFNTEADDQLLRWLTLEELGNYLFLVGDTHLTWTIRKQVADELATILGPEHPLSLRARSESAYSCFLSNNMRQALADYQYLYETQHRILGPQKPGTLNALAYCGHAQYYLGHSKEALESLNEAVKGFRLISGETHINTLGYLWNIAILYEAYGRDDKAMEILEKILVERVKALGTADLFAVMVRISIGNISRRRSLAEETFKQLNQAFQIRLNIWPKTHYLVVDAALARAVAYWHFDMPDEGMTQLRDIKLEDNLMSRYQRLCQWTHLHALFSIEGKKVRNAITILRTLSLNAERDQVNRALLWARLDLALLLRRTGLSDEASALFHNLVHDSEHDPDDQEPDPPRYLDIAERALRHTRVGRVEEARYLLDSERLQWVREEDLWFWVGGPRVDTEFMREP
ncbi:ankyrin repeat domain-containing protein 50 [Microdochium nivale]|nr:ankyrin repeat domain-containing protein 50 [Microdochium nivale]